MSKQRKLKRKFATYGERCAYAEDVYSRLSSMRRRKLLQLSEAQGHRCAYCCEETWHRQTVEWDWESEPAGPKRNARQATLEHFRPQCRKEQTNQEDNLIMCCNRCNNWRGTKDPYVYYRQLRVYTPPVELTVRPKQLTTEQKANLPARLGRQMALGLIAWYFWPEESQAALDLGLPELTMKERKRLKCCNYQINLKAKEIVQDPRRMTA